MRAAWTTTTTAEPALLWIQPQNSQVTHFEIPTVMRADYQYYADGRLSYSHDLDDARYDRAYNYDHAARITDGLSGSEARGVQVADGPYKESFARGWRGIIPLHSTCADVKRLLGVTTCDGSTHPLNDETF